MHVRGPGSGAVDIRRTLLTAQTGFLTTPPLHVEWAAGRGAGAPVIRDNSSGQQAQYLGGSGLGAAAPNITPSSAQATASPRLSCAISRRATGDNIKPGFFCRAATGLCTASGHNACVTSLRLPCCAGLAYPRIYPASAAKGRDVRRC